MIQETGTRMGVCQGAFPRVNETGGGSGLGCVHPAARAAVGGLDVGLCPAADADERHGGVRVGEGVVIL